MKTQHSEKEIEVLIVGAGPVGLMMACQLAIQGIRFRIIDKKEHASSYSGALIIQARSVEIFHQMGLSQKLIHEGIIANNINILFNGEHLLKIPVRNIGSGLTRFPYILMVKQSKTEHLLTQFINERGFQIERKSEFISFMHDADGVTSAITNSKGKQEIIKSRYLIAADGGLSTIRQQLSIQFIGKGHQKSLFIIDCKAETEMKADEISIAFSNKSISGFFPLVGGKWRVDGTIPDTLESKDILTFSDVEEEFSKRLKMEIKVHNPDWFSVFHAQQLYATSFKEKHCFLLGDAAHVHSPVGAQGMNTGLQDAYNLAWKLAFVINNKVKPHLLDSYTSERLPIARNIISATDNIFNLVTSDRFITKVFRLYILPSFIKYIFPLFGHRIGIRQHIFKSISEVGIHYRKSNLSHQPFRLLPFKSPRSGDRLPFILYKENGEEINIQDKVKGNEFHLFLFSSKDISQEIINITEKYKKILSFDIILYSSQNNHLFKSMGIKRDGCILIRPDLYIAYHSNTHRAKHLENYLQTYFELI